MQLSKRMKMNADFVPEGSSVADVGCDHGYVSIYLVQQKKCSRVIAMDVKEGPLQIARKNIRRENLDGQIECRLSDGLEKLIPGEVNTVLIAGMGGRLICRILQKNPEILDEITHLVLQPQSDYEMLRRLLPEIHFEITKENFCVDENKPYVVIQAVKSTKEQVPYRECEFYYGKMELQQNPVEYREYLLQERGKMIHIIEKLKDISTEHSLTRREELVHTLKCMDEILK